MRIPLRRGRFFCGLAATVGLVASAGAARATDGEASGAVSGALTQELIGLELTPVSLSLTQAPSRAQDGGPARLQAGPGGVIRLLRHRWTYAYIIPIAAGFYVSVGGSGGNNTILARVQTEAGVIVPGTDGRLELGLAAGAALLAIGYAPDCDGTCRIGGKGAMVSPVVRYLFLDGAPVTVGASVRAIVPLTDPQGEGFGYFTGGGRILLGAVEFGFGRGAPAVGSGAHHPVDDGGQRREARAAASERDRIPRFDAEARLAILD
jgi:hypothetical protein